MVAHKLLLHLILSDHTTPLDRSGLRGVGEEEKLATSSETVELLAVSMTIMKMVPMTNLFAKYVDQYDVHTFWVTYDNHNKI